MIDQPDATSEDPVVVGVPPETPDAVRSSDVDIVDLRATPEERATVEAGGDPVDIGDDEQPQIEGPNSL